MNNGTTAGNAHMHDVAIIGGGLVGASLALALQPIGLDIALVEPHPVAAAPTGENWDSRIYAISPGNAAFLEGLGVWSRLDPQRVQRVETMAISGDRRDSRLEFSAYDAGLRELAWIVESGALQRALLDAIYAAGGVRMCCPAQAEGLAIMDSAATITLADGAMLDAQLVVGTDGRDSLVRREAGIDARISEYRQFGVVANFETEKSHHGTAFQWFRADGILALLPLPGNRVSMVWSTTEQHTQELLALDGGALADAVAEASGGTAGALRLITPAAAFPLRLAQIARLVAPRVALAGDAAHNVHPLAGQGVNLGFRDVRMLSGVLAGRAPRQDCGDLALLRRYERARREDIAAIAFSTDALQKLFGAESVWLSGVRNFGLGALNHLPVLKNLLIQHAAA
jgi:ubiquinone biosynthesis UbiH/UbiF/VisC/COQ6 family hydroxylase